MDNLNPDICTSFESHLPQHDITSISSVHLRPVESVLVTWNLYSFLLQSSPLRSSNPTTESCCPATENHTITEVTVHNTVAQTIVALQRKNGNTNGLHKYYEFFRLWFSVFFPGHTVRNDRVTCMLSRAIQTIFLFSFRDPCSPRLF